MKASLTLLILTSLLSLTACDKRGPLRTELTQAETQMEEKQALVVKLQEELRTMPSLGKYNFAGASQVQAIRAEVDKLEAEINQLKADKKAAEAINQKLRDDVDAYLAKHSKK